jgi:hypothetical protein
MKNIKRHFFITTVVTLLLYFMVSFVFWDIWIIRKLPETDEWARALIVFLFIINHGITSIFNETFKQY